MSPPASHFTKAGGLDPEPGDGRPLPSPPAITVGTGTLDVLVGDAEAVGQLIVAEIVVAGAVVVAISVVVAVTVAVAVTVVVLGGGFLQVG